MKVGGESEGVSFDKMLLIYVYCVVKAYQRTYLSIIFPQSNKLSFLLIVNLGTNHGLAGQKLK